MLFFFKFFFDTTYQYSQSIGRPKFRLTVCWVKKQIPYNKPIMGAMSASRKLQLLESDLVT